VNAEDMCDERGHLELNMWPWPKPWNCDRCGWVERIEELEE
jgi:hypothetical protein